jgi:hypothetical protein
MTTPARPEQIPANATFNGEMALWEIVEHDAEGRLHGAFTAFRDDGSVVARGTYAHGELDGLLSRYSDGTQGAAALRPCCVPPGAREIRARYRAGRLLEEIFYDGSGRPLCEDGTPWPERRGDVPPDARFDETNRRFVVRLEQKDGSTTFRYYDADGVVADELDATAGQARAHRRFFPDGTLAERTSIDENGQRHGEYLARFEPSTSPYEDARIAQLRGQHEHGEPVGGWDYLDAAGALVKRVEYGARLESRDLELVAGRDSNPESNADPLAELERAAAASPRAAAAFVARSAAKAGNLDEYARFTAARTVALRPDVATVRANEAVSAKNVTLSSLLGAVLGGAEPSVLFRTLASSLEGNAPAALDYFDVSLLLAPRQSMAAMGRALLCIEHGEPAGALAAAERAETEVPDAARSLREFTRVTYFAFPFRPAVDGIGAPEEELVEVELQQPLDAIERTLELYATRLLVVRGELARRAGHVPPWAPPDTTSLLSHGPRALARRTAQIEDEGENGPEITQVEIDETLPLERSTRRLLAVARADWAALCWLCWAAGLDEVARPGRVMGRPDFAAAAHQATVRCWRAHDRLRLSGLVALARQVASFDWEGIPIDAVPPHLIELAAAEYLEVRALFFWLLFPQNESPFQQDLRRV